LYVILRTDLQVLAPICLLTSRHEQKSTTYWCRRAAASCVCQDGGSCYSARIFSQWPWMEWLRVMHHNEKTAIHVCSVWHQ